MTRDRYDTIPLERLAAGAAHALRAVWLKEPGAPRELPYRSGRIRLECRRFRIVEDLRPAWGVAYFRDDSAAFFPPPELRPGAVIDVFSEGELHEGERRVEVEEGSRKSRIVEVVELAPTRPGDEGILLLGNWHASLGAFVSVVGWSFVPLKELDRVTAHLPPRDPDAPEWTRSPS